MNNAYVKAGLISLAAFALVAAIQRHVMTVPVVGEYLPK